MHVEGHLAGLLNLLLLVGALVLTLGQQTLHNREMENISSSVADPLTFWVGSGSGFGSGCCFFRN